MSDQREIVQAAGCAVRRDDDSCHRLALLCLSVPAAPAQRRNPVVLDQTKSAQAVTPRRSGSCLPRTRRALRRGEFFTIRDCDSLAKAPYSVRASDNARQEHNRDRCHRRTYIWLVTHSQLSTQRHEDLTVPASSRGQVDRASKQPSSQPSKYLGLLPAS